MSYVHYIDLLMWSPTKFNFSFYNLFMIYYDFSKNSSKINIKKRGKQLRTTIHEGDMSSIVSSEPK